MDGRLRCETIDTRGRQLAQQSAECPCRQLPKHSQKNRSSTRSRPRDRFGPVRLVPARPAAWDVDDAQLGSRRVACRWSGGAAFVVMMETVQMRVGDDRTGPRRLDGARRGRILVQGQVRPDAMVILQVELKRSSERPFIPHDAMIQTECRAYCYAQLKSQRTRSPRFRRGHVTGSSTPRLHIM